MINGIGIGLAMTVMGVVAVLNLDGAYSVFVLQVWGEYSGEVALS